jgi:hypothetical protein
MNTLGKLILAALVIGVTLYWATDNWDEQEYKPEEDLFI